MLPISMLLTEVQAAREAQVDRRVIRKLIESGRLKAIDFGCRRHRYRIEPSELTRIKAPVADDNASHERRRLPVGEKRPCRSSPDPSAYLPTV